MGCPPRSEGPSRRARVRSQGPHRPCPVVLPGDDIGSTAANVARFVAVATCVRQRPWSFVGRPIMCSVIQPLGDWTARGGSTGFVQWCRPPRLKQLPPADPLCRSRSRPRGGLEHGAGPADGQHSPIGLMCRIYGAVRFQIRGGARPALVTELKPTSERLPRSFPPCPTAAEGGPRLRHRWTTPRRRGRRGHHPGLGTPRPRTATRRDAGTARDAGRRPCSTSRGIGTGAAP